MMRPWLLMLVGCSGAMLGPDALVTDGDSDGWTPANGDCNDADPTVFPTALDVPNDDIDQDCNGVDAEGASVRSLAAGDLRITEIMLGPLGVEADAGEWIEVLNVTDQPVDLMGLLIRDDVRDDTFVTESLVVGAGELVVFGGSLDLVVNGGVPVDAVWNAGFGLSKEDTVVLDVDGLVIDRVSYDPTWPLEDGRSLSLSGAEGLADDPGDWCVGAELYGVGGYGSPGEINPGCPDAFEGRTAGELVVGDVVITEILQAPEAAGGDFAEWIEVHNTTSVAIDLKGVELLDETDSGLAIETPLLVPAGGYVVLAASEDSDLNGDVDADWAWGWEYSLRNSGQTVRLVFGTTELDAVSYDNGLTFPDAKGASMSLSPLALDPEANDDGYLWCEATTEFGDGDLGTPGMANPNCPEVLRVAQLEAGDVVITEIMATPTSEEGEWIELFNATAMTIDLAGLELSGGAGTFTVPSGTSVEAGAHVVLGESDDADENGGAAVDVVYDDAIRWGVGDDAELHAAGLLVDAVSYDPSFGGALGASLSLRPSKTDAGENDDGLNWCTAPNPFGDGDLGSPGDANDPC